MSKKTRVALAAAATLTLGGLAWSQLASAHVPNVAESCAGITWSGHSYPPGDVATLTVNGVTQTAIVGPSASFSLSATFPGVGTSTYAYSVDSVDDPFDASGSGTQIGCQGDTTTTTVAETTTTLPVETTTTLPVETTTTLPVETTTTTEVTTSVPTTTSTVPETTTPTTTVLSTTTLPGSTTTETAAPTTTVAATTSTTAPASTTTLPAVTTTTTVAPRQLLPVTR